MLKFSQLMELKSKPSREGVFDWDADDTEVDDSIDADDSIHEITEKKSSASEDDPHRDVKAGFKEHAKTLKRSHVDELKYYKHNQEINHALRATPKSHSSHDLDHHDSKQVKKLDHVTSHETKGHMTVYRGLTDGHMKRNKGLPPGHKFTDHGYASASFHKHVAAAFGDKKTKRIMAIHAPPGTKAHHFDAHKNENQHEGEVVFHRGTKFRVTHHEHDGEHHIVHAHVVSQRPKKVWGS